jgi:hypothetical protein
MHSDDEFSVLASVLGEPMGGEMSHRLVAAKLPRFEPVAWRGQHRVSRFDPLTGRSNSDELQAIHNSRWCGIPPCPCDCADPPDGVVDIVDFLALLGQWGTPGSCDADGNGVVDITDFLGMLARWGPCP